MVVRININTTPSLRKLGEAFKRLENATGDLTKSFEIIASDFYKSNEGLIFSAKPGKYADLKTSTKEQKSRKYGFIYPVLVASGRLKASLTKRGNVDNITNITKREMVLGTNVPYSTYLQVGTKNMDARPPIILEVGRRVFRWIRIINETALKEVKLKPVR